MTSPVPDVTSVIIQDLGINYENLIQLAAQLKTDVFAYEYPGYGASDPTSQPSEAGCYDAADVAFDHVTNVVSPPRSSSTSSAHLFSS